jgi:hypothetical protein
LDVDSLQCFTLALQIPVLTWIREMERRKKVAWGTLNDMLPTLLSPYPTREEERPSLEKRSQMTSLLGKPVLLDTFKIVVLQEQQMGIAGIAVVRLIRSVAEESSTGTLNVVTDHLLLAQQDKERTIQPTSQRRIYLSDRSIA